MSSTIAAVAAGFGEGVRTALLLPTHGLPLLAIGLLIGGRARPWLPFVGFVAGLAAGLVALIAAIGEMPALPILLTTSALAGLLVALAMPVPAGLSAALALVTGCALALDSPPQATSIAAAYAALAGTGAAAILLVGVVSAANARFARDWQRVGIRIIASWITASALLLLALVLIRSF